MNDLQFNVAVNATGNLSKELKTIESSVIRFVGAISSALTALATIGFPVLSAANFQKELLNAAKTTQYTRQEIDMLREGLSDLSKQTNVSAVDLAKIATMGGQIGIGEDGNVEALIAFTKSIATAVSSLDISAEEAVESMGKLINIFNIVPSEFDKVVSSLTAVSVASTATASSLFDVVRRVGNLGGSVTLPQAAALAASMIDLGLTAETAGTTITKIFADMKSNAEGFANVALKGNVSTNRSLKELRFTTEEWINLVATDGVAALQAYITGLNNMGETQAAQTKSQLTGEGRLFEAVTKMQQQRRRQTVIETQLYEVEKNLQKLRLTGVDATQGQIEAEEARAEALRGAAVQANVMSRLGEKANAAFLSGAEGAKAQQTVLVGLLAQWKLFANTVDASARSIGDVAIPPLTNLLRTLTSGIQSGGAEQELAQASKEIVAVIVRIGDAIAYVKTFFSGGGGFDWGALLRFTAILTGIALIKTLTSLFKVLSASALNAIPGVSALGQALFGVKQGADAAKNAVDGVAAATARSATGGRTGGWISGLVSGAKSAAEAYAVQTRQIILNTQRATEESAAYWKKMRGAMVPAADALAQITQRFGTVSVAQAKMVEWQNRLATASKGSATAIRTQMAYWGPIINQYEGASAAVSRYAAKIAGLDAYLAKLNTKKAAAIPLLPQVQSAAAKFVDAGKKAYTEFMQGFASGGAAGGLASALTPMVKSVGELFSKGFSKDSMAAMWKSITTGTDGAVGSLNTYMAKLAGLEVAWLSSTTAASKFFTATIAGFLLLGKAIGFVVKAVLAFANIFFIGLMLIELAKMIGLWDRIALAIQKVLKIFGVSDESMPSFLKVGKQAEEATVKIDKLTDAYKRNREEAAKFGSPQAATIAVASVPKVAAADLAYNEKTPNSAAENTVKYLEAIRTGYSLAEQASQNYKATQEQLTIAAKAHAATTVPLAQANLRMEKSIGAVQLAEERLGAAQEGSPDRLSSVEAATRKLAEVEADRQRAYIQYAKPAVEAEEAARGRVYALQEAMAGLEVQIKKTGGTTDKPFKGVEDAATNLVQGIFTATEATALFTEEQASGLSRMGEYTQALIQQAAAEKALQDAMAAQESSKSAKEGTINPAQLAAQQLAVAQTEAALNGQKEKVDSLTASMTALGRTPESIKTFLDAFKSKDLVAMNAQLQAMTVATLTLKNTDFKGLNLPKVEGKDLLTVATTIAVKTRMKDMYAGFSKYAKEEAERAKNYTSQALGEMQKAARATESFITKIAQNQEAAAKKAANQKLDRADDATSRQITRNIQTQYDTERALLEQNFAVQQRTLQEQEQGGMNVFTQKAEMYAFEQQAMFELEERYKAVFDIEADRLNLQKQRRAANDEVAQFDKMIKRAEYLKQVVAESNRIMNNPTASTDARYGALVKRNDALDKMRAIYSQLESSAERLSSMDPIGGEVVADPAALERMKTAITDVSSSIGKLNLEGAGSIEGILNGVSQAAAGMSKQLDDELGVARAAFQQMAIAAKDSNETVGAMADGMARIIATSPAFAASLNTMQDALRNGLASPGAVNFDEMRKTMDTAIKSVVAQGDIKVPIKADTAELAKSISDGILMGTSSAGTATTPVVVPVTPTIAADGMTKLQGDINAQPSAKVDVTLEATKLDVSRIQGQLNVTFDAKANARGGLIGSVVALSEGMMAALPRFALGGSPGRVTGPGTGTSDSILSWLSNGEYVMDALTTSRFGSRFFATLQKMARGGKSSSFLSKVSLPSFATGGPVGIPASLMKEFETDFKKEAAKRDTVDINISDGKRTATIQAEREQARSLIGILRSFER